MLTLDSKGIEYANLYQDIKTLLMPKNWIINGMFDVWQRGTSQTTAGYGSDDRFMNEHNGSAKTHSRQAFTIGQTDVPNNPTYFSRTVVNSVAGAGNHTRKIQFIEDVTKLAGKTVTVSFWAKADANKNISIEFIQAFGTGGSTTVTGIGVQKFPLTTAWQRFTKTIALPSINGKTIGANNLMGLYFWLDAGSNLNARTDSLGNQSGTFDIANVSLVEGSVAVECQNQPYADVLRECQDYYRRGLQFSQGMTAAINEGYLYARFSTMRKVPVARVIAGSSLTDSISEINIAERTPTSFSLTPTKDTLAMIALGATFSATGRLIILKSDIIELDAEL